MTKKKDGGTAPEPAGQQGGGKFDHAQTADLKDLAAEQATKRDKKEKKLQKALPSRPYRLMTPSQILTTTLILREKKKKKSQKKTSKHTKRNKSKVAKLRGQVDTLHEQEYTVFTAKVKPATPVKKGILTAVAASAASDNSGYGHEESLEACAKVSDLGKKGPITSSADTVAKQASKLCHQRYFSDPGSLGELKDMVQRSGLGTQATHGNTIILAIIKAAISRGLDLSPEDMGLKLEELKIE